MEEVNDVSNDNSSIKEKIIQSVYQIVDIQTERATRSRIWTFFKRIQTNDNIMLENKFVCPKCCLVIHHPKEKKTTSNFTRYKCYTDHANSESDGSEVDDEALHV